MKKCGMLVLSLVLIGSSCFAGTAEKETKVVIPPTENKNEDVLKDLDYPELQVVPRASDRLAMETQNERESGWVAFWPYQISALATLMSGYRLHGNYHDDGMSDQQKRDSDNIANGAMIVGGAWLALSVYLIKMDLYADAMRRVRAVKGTDKRSDLLRERMAEESLERPAELMNTLTTLSVVSNAAASIAVLTQANGDVRIYGAVSLLASFLPWMFQSRYVENWNKHLEYKRKIYTPLVGLDLRFEPQYQKYQPQLTMNWNF